MERFFNNVVVESLLFVAKTFSFTKEIPKFVLNFYVLWQSEQLRY